MSKEKLLHDKYGSPLITAEQLQVRFEKSKQLNIAIVALAEMGHYIPMIRLASALESANHKVTIFSNNYNKDKATKMKDQNDIKGELVFPDESLGVSRE